MKNRTTIDLILALLKDKYDKKRARALMVEQRRELGQRIYNLSREIEKLDDEAAALMGDLNNAN